jgi:hypothetical protein
MLTQHHGPQERAAAKSCAPGSFLLKETLMLAPGEKAFRRVLHIVIALLLGTTVTLIAVEASGGTHYADGAPAQAD